ncbi:hypothetical protein K438DRAFT_1965221 [Mycena galopus ATCC 62051]|nr:hypothetical protein K438DRAFT_1965221 [Mycena galopus ATCC 62051]
MSMTARFSTPSVRLGADSASNTILDPRSRFLEELVKFGLKTALLLLISVSPDLLATIIKDDDRIVRSNYTGREGKVTQVYRKK